MANDLGTMLGEKLKEFPTMSVATANASGVDCATVFFAQERNGCLVFATAAGTLKAENIQKGSRVAVAMDDNRQTGVQMRGIAHVLSGAEAVEARRLLAERQPSLTRFLDKPGVIYIRFKPEERFLINFAWGVDWRVPVNR